ncbi:MAG: sulfite oxidase-like oxidoreductase [Deltaproteobacteria bacterium]
MSDEDRIVAARMKLRERHLAGRAPTTPSDRARGSGPENRHGMPKLPTGQHAVDKWPVLDLGRHPIVDPKDWQLTIDGAVEERVTLDWSAFMALPQVDEPSDFHCVTTWSKMDLAFRGVRVRDALALARPHDDASHVMLHAYDGYTTNVSLDALIDDDVLLAHTVDGQPLPRPHGGPVRVVTPKLYAWKGAKWVNRIELLVGDQPGFWEARGYSMTALPWDDDRYR